MDVVFEGPRVKLTKNLVVKDVLCDVVTKTSALKTDAAALLEHLRTGVAIYPTVKEVHHDGMECNGCVIRYELDGVMHYNAVLRIWMPCNESQLLWMPWLPHQVQPLRNPGGFHHVKPGAFYALQARQTKCYGYAYAYSGQTHPVEDETPAEIVALYRETNSIFGLPLDGRGGANMCLENDYGNGRFYISEHSDDESSFGAIHDVFCWITGEASREGVFRVRTMGGKNKHLVATPLHQYCCDPSNAFETRDLLRICIPAGFYGMCGRQFQQRYSHEFPVLHENLFDRIAKGAPKHLDGFPVDVPVTDKGASQRPVVQAAWIRDHRDEVLAKIDEGAFATTKRHKIQTTPEEDHVAFEEWCLPRTSYTLRNFRVREEGEVTKKRKTKK